jgi:flagellar motility protein MotE (MotC chaperone)
MKFPRPRVLPFAIALTIVSMGMRAVDTISMALSGPAFSAVTPAVAETAKPDATPAADPTQAKDQTDKTLVATAEPPPVGVPSHPPIQSPEDSKSATDLLQSLNEKRKQLDAQQQELDQREALLKAAEERIDHKVDELSQMRTDMEKLLDIQKVKDDAQLASLVKIYENMKPKDAAAIFDNLELPILVDVTARMKEAKVAPILAAMSTDRARVLTVKLAEHRRVMDGAVADAKAVLGDTSGDAKPTDANGATTAPAQGAPAAGAPPSGAAPAASNP